MSKTPCVFLRGGDLTAIIGDDTPRGTGGRQYSGIWSLYHKQSNSSPFQAGMAGLIANPHRGTEPELGPINESSARLVKGPTDQLPFATTTGTYTLHEPHFVDYRFDVSISPAAADIPECTEFLWASYMNSPKDSSIFFVENGQWTSFAPRIHGLDAMIFPTRLEPLRRQGWERHAGEDKFREQESFWQSDAGRTFDYPFYFGLIHGMVFLLMADTHRDFRIFTSPIGAGGSRIPGQMDPAWDFAWNLWNAEPGQTYALNVRLAYFHQPLWDLPKRVWQEWERFREEFGLQNSESRN